MPIPKLASRPTQQQLRTYATARSLFAPTTLSRAIHRLGFVQADPIRAPARAQDLTLRHRVKDYRAGDLEKHYAKLPIEEDFFINYGFLPRATQQLMHPRSARIEWPQTRWAQAQAVLDFIRIQGVVHPREVDAAFDHGKSKNWFGGSSNASTQLLDGMHYRGLLRVARREGGTRLYAVRETPVEPAAPACDPAAVLDCLVDVAVAKYAPLPKRSLSELISHLALGAPQWRQQRSATLARTLQRLPQAEVDGITWYWPEGENPASRRWVTPEGVHLLAPFDPVVWDRRRFELFWGWAYRFEAYTPAPKRVRGYYALPLLWRDQVIGWCNLAMQAGRLVPGLGYVAGQAPRERDFKLALDEELQRVALFLSLR